MGPAPAPAWRPLRPPRRRRRPKAVTANARVSLAAHNTAGARGDAQRWCPPAQPARRSRRPGAAAWRGVLCRKRQAKGRRRRGGPRAAQETDVCGAGKSSCLVRRLSWRSGEPLRRRVRLRGHARGNLASDGAARSCKALGTTELLLRLLQAGYRVFRSRVQRVAGRSATNPWPIAALRARCHHRSSELGHRLARLLGLDLLQRRRWHRRGRRRQLGHSAWARLNKQACLAPGGHARIQRRPLCTQAAAR